LGFQTDCTTTGEDRQSYEGSVSPPIYASSLFVAPTLEEFEAALMDQGGSRYVYTRLRNPTVEVLEQKLALLERAEACKFFASGMAAIAAVVMDACQAGQHVIAGWAGYNHAYKLLAQYLPSYGIETTFVDTTSVEAIEAAIRPTTRLLYLESPANPTMQIVDIAACVELARGHGLATAVDNSLPTPYNQRPSEYGTDYTIHSATKYLGGHSDAVAGAVTGSHERIGALSARQHADLGGIIGPFEGWLILRGMRTLGIRMQVHNRSAATIAGWLEHHPKVKRVHYPGLESHPQVALAKRQMSGGSGLVGVVVHGGFEAARTLADTLKLFGIGVSWGGFESLALPMWRISSMPVEMRRDIGLEESFVRLSMGLEDVEDLQTDLEDALATI